MVGWLRRVTGLAEISAGDARRLVLAAQGLAAGSLGKPSSRASLTRRTAAVDATLRRLGAVQLDTVSVLARSHELVAYARLGPVGRDAVEAAYWGGGRDLDHPDEATTFEYWSHAASILPVEEWPLFAFRRRAYQRRGFHWHQEPTRAVQQVRAALAAEGPLTTAGLGGAKRSADWWDWSDAKVAVEWLLMLGEVVCVRRIGWRRVYDLAERAIPERHRTPGPGDAPWVDDEGIPGPSDDDCLRALLLRSARVCGVATRADLLDVHRLASRSLTRERVDGLLGDLEADGLLRRVRVEGWPAPAYAEAEALDSLDAVSGRSRTTLLSPFDSLVWHRGRTSRLFGFDYQMELYVPRERRVHGYFTMPVLHGGRLVARVDPARKGRVLSARQVTFETGRSGSVPASAVRGTAAALREAASWVGCETVSVGRVVPESARTPLEGALLRP